jgi:hypothetical protein
MSDDFDNDMNWLQDDDDDVSSSGENDEFVPDWMQETSDDDSASASDDDLVMDWMQETSDDDSATTSDDDVVPDWMQETSDDDSAAASDDDLAMDWMPDTSDGEEGLAEEQDDVPDWMQDDDFDDKDDEISTLFSETSDDDDGDEDTDWMAEGEDEPGHIESASMPSNTSMLDDLFSDADALADEDDELTDDDFADFLGELDESEVEAAPDFGDLFADEEFSAEVEETASEFDMLGELTGGADSVDDLLGELAGDDVADEGVFDLLGELGRDDISADEGEFAVEKMPDFGSDDDDLAPMEGAPVDLFADTSVDDLFGDDDLTPIEAAPIDTGIDELIDDDLLTFDDADLFEDNLLDDFGPEEYAAPEPESYTGVDDFLAGLDDDTSIYKEIDETGVDTGTDFDDFLDAAVLDDFGDEVDEIQELSPDAPEWMRDLRESAADDTSAAAIVRQQKDRPVDELSDRLLNLRERGMELPSPQAENEPAALSDVLPGVKQTLPPIALKPEDVILAVGVELTDTQLKHMDLLQTVVGAGLYADEEEEAKKTPLVRRIRARVPIERLFITAILLLAVVLPFFADTFNFGELPPAEFAVGSQQQDFFEQVNALQPGQMVLIAAEYGPTSASELDDATVAIIRHVLVRQAYPVIIGGNPVGLLHVSNIMDDLIEQNSDNVTTSDYTIGRYLVGDVIGLRDFNDNLDEIIAIDFWGEDTNLEVNSMDDFALVILIAEHAERVRAWAEQVIPQTDTSFLIVTGFGAEPLSAPYIDSNQDITGVLVGYKDSYTYNYMLDVMLGLQVIPTATPTELPTATPTELPPTAIPTDTPLDEEPTQVDAVEPTDAPSDGEVLPTSEDGAEPTEEIVEVTAMIAPTDTPIPTDTPVPTDTPIPTDTPEPTNTNTPMPTATPEPILYAVITADGTVNVRAEPVSGAVIGTAQPGDRLLIVGLNDDASWYNVELPDGRTGWIADFLAEVDVVTPEPPEATPTRESSDAGGVQKLSVMAKMPVQQEPTPTREGDVAESPTPQPTNTVRPTQTPVPTATSTPSRELDTVIDEDGRVMVTIALEDDEYRDARWYGMTLGIVAAVVIIAFGNLINIVRFLRKRRRREE